MGQPVPRVHEAQVNWLPDSRALLFNQLRELPPGAAATETYLDTSVMLMPVGGKPMLEHIIERARGEGFRIDPAAVDGALQFALLWAQSVLGGATLPMSVAAFESFVDGVAEGPIRCVVHGREAYSATSGDRYLRGCYADRGELRSAYRLLAGESRFK